MSSNSKKKSKRLFKTTIKDKDADLKEIKIQTNPGYHTLGHILDKFEKKLESFRDQMTNAIKDSCSNALKLYTAVIKPDGIASDKSARGRTLLKK